LILYLFKSQSDFSLFEVPPNSSSRC